MDWKVRLEGEDNTLTQLQSAHSSPAAKVSRDGVDWYLESSDFEPLTDHVAVREKATAIVQSVLAAQNVGLGPVIRMHYDGSKSIFRADSQ
jgi:hypothetical protein